MNEVSCRVLQIWLKPIAAKGIPLESVVAGTSLSIAALRDKHGRLSWQEFSTIHANMRPYFTDHELVEIGRSYFRAPALRFVFVIARLLLTPMGFYRWLNKPRQGAGNQIFNCVVPHHREISEHECEIELTLPEPYEPCWDFFLVSRGNMEEMPRLLGYAAATVTLEPIPQGARYHITIPPRARFLTRLRRALTWPFTVRAAARELQEAHETLRERYAELDAARTMLDRQRALLDVAYRFGQRVWDAREPTAAVGQVATAMLELGGFAAAAVEVAPIDAPSRIERAGTTVVVADPRLRVDLAATGRLSGEIRVQLASGASIDDAHALLDLLAPTIALALENAFAYRALSEHQAGLERVVDERTRELRDARDQLAASVGELRQARDVRERFFANISHEIRTPLSLILLAVRDIETRAAPVLDDRARGNLGAVGDAARKLVRLVDELLLLAAGQEGKLQVHPEPTDVVALLGHLAAAWRPAAEAAGLELVSALPTQLVALVDPIALERVASNLMSNAVKYTPRGGRVELVLADEPDGVRLSVLDDGPGIGDELAARLFGRFERAVGDDRRKTGTGLGLSLVKQLVEAHGGVVSARPRPGGTDLRVVLPRSIVLGDATAATRALQLHDAPTAAATIASGTVLVPPQLSAGTILLAEDDAALAELVARLLADRYTVVVALDGAHALALARQHHPQLLVTDVDMPELNGIELARSFRELAGDQLAPIIMLSAVIDPRTRITGLEAGAIDYINKPFDPRELSARVDAQFRMRDLATRLHRAEQLSALGILTSGLAHELRNPANGIVNAIGPLTGLLPAELTQPDTAVSQLLEVMSSCAEQVGFLARQLLGFRSSTELELRPAQLPDLVERAVSIASRSLAGVELRVDVAAAREVVCAPPLLVQVLTNLVDNAAHAAGPGGWVALRGYAHGDAVVVEISDSGPGVPVALRERVFEPFFTTKPEGKGTGLGLSVARAIIQRHRGVLEIREHHGRPVFVIELPGNSTPAARANAI